ncbi:response regulator [Methylobacterium sp. P31]
MAERQEGIEAQPKHATTSLIVLLVDDDDLVRSGTAVMLEDLGHAVMEAETGDQALQQLAARESRADVVITDQVMPGMTGLELIRQIERQHPSLPVILASGYTGISQGEPVDDALRLPKPFRQAELAEAIAEVCRRTAGRNCGEQSGKHSKRPL